MMSFARLCFCFFVFFLTQNTPINCHLFVALTKTQPIPRTAPRSSICRAGSPRCRPDRWAGGSRDCLDDPLLATAASSSERAWRRETQTRLSAQGNSAVHRGHREPSSTKRWRLTCLGPGCLEARRPRRRCPGSSCVPRRTPPRAAPASWCAGRDGTRTPLSPPCRCWRDVSRCESAAGGPRAESRLGSRWRSERVSRPRWISWT